MQRALYVIVCIVVLAVIYWAVRFYRAAHVYEDYYPQYQLVFSASVSRDNAVVYDAMAYSATYDTGGIELEACPIVVNMGASRVSLVNVSVMDLKTFGAQLDQRTPDGATWRVASPDGTPEYSMSFHLDAENDLIGFTYLVGQRVGHPGLADLHVGIQSGEVIHLPLTEGRLRTLLGRPQKRFARFQPPAF